MGSPGPGNVVDHVVAQSQLKSTRSAFPREQIHSVDNMIPVSARTNQIKANYYASKTDFSEGLRVRDWLNGQSFDKQYSFGMDVLADIKSGLIK